MTFKVQLVKTDEGFSVWCPALPGCASQGDTEAEALENIQEAIAAYLESVAMTQGPEVANSLLRDAVDSFDREVAVDFQSPPITQSHA